MKKKCFTHEGKNIYYSDAHHLSEAGAEKLNNIIFQEIVKINSTN